MSDADLIYAALLRAERRMETTVYEADPPGLARHLVGALLAVRTIREEIGNGLAARPSGDVG